MDCEGREEGGADVEKEPATEPAAEAVGEPFAGLTTELVAPPADEQGPKLVAVSVATPNELAAAAVVEITSARASVIPRRIKPFARPQTQPPNEALPAGNMEGVSGAPLLPWREDRVGSSAGPTTESNSAPCVPSPCLSPDPGIVKTASCVAVFPPASEVASHATSLTRASFMQASVQPPSLKPI